jgi:predicted aspartyl protease
MRRVITLLALSAVLLPWVFAAPDDTTAFGSLYARRRWTELYGAVQHRKDQIFFRGVVAAVFGQDQRGASLLRSVILSSPHSEQAYEAYEWLTHIYFRNGRYRSLMANMEARWAAFPNKPERKNEQAALAGFRSLPDQTADKPRDSTLRHDPKQIFIPLTIDNTPATYFFDTGAWVNGLSVSEAKRLGLVVQESQGSLGTATGQRVALRTAVAREVVIGGMHFRNVSFAVFNDEEEPWSDLAPGRRGLIGMPIILGFRTLRWSEDGTVRIGSKGGGRDPLQANLFFDDDHLLTSARLGDAEVRATLDTGAETTDLYLPFANRFPALTEAGAKNSMDIRGVGNKQTFDSITVPEVRFELGKAGVVLKPAHVFLKDIGAKNCIGNFGIDLLMQSRAFRIDFGAMRLDLEPAR